MIHYHVYSQTDIGKKRDHNEDSFLVEEKCNLFVIADGMGGHAAGEVASANAVKEIKKVILDNFSLITSYQEDPISQKRWAVRELVEKAVQSANLRIYQLSRIDPAQKKMGTTVSCLLLLENHGILGHVGDSRIYLVREGTIHQLTEDHSLVNQYLKQGRITEEEAQVSPYQNVLTRAVGVQEWVNVDLVDFELEQNDRFVLTSDGLTGYVNDEELLTYMSNDKLDTITTELIDLANERGGKDNITAILIDVDRISIEETITPATQKINSLKTIPLFQKLTYQQFTQVANILHEVKYNSGETIIAEGDAADTFYICIDGRVKVLKGNTTITELKPGDYFGEMSLVDNETRSADVIAVENTSLLTMSRKNLIELIRQNPGIAIKFLWNFTQVLTKRLRQTSEELSIAFGEPYELTDLMDMDTEILPPD